MASRILVLASTVVLVPGLLGAQTLGLAHGGVAAPIEARRTTHRTLEATAGTTLDGGFVVSTSLGVSPVPWLTLLAAGESYHVPTRYSTFASDYGYGSSVSRGFTTFVLGGEVRVGSPARRRVSQYLAIGLGGGAWRGNQEGHSPRRDGGPLTLGTLGGGVRVRLRHNLAFVADGRLTVGGGGENFLAYVPIKGGVAWNF
jgi:hypothetical protein